MHQNSEISYGWTSATTDYYKAIQGLYSCLNSGHNAWIARMSNLVLAKEQFSFPLLTGNNKMPYRDRKIIDCKVYVVAFNSQPMKKLPLWVLLLNIITYPVRFVPKRSVLRMDKYTCYTYRVGGVINGFSIEFQIPKKFSFKD